MPYARISEGAPGLGWSGFRGVPGLPNRRPANPSPNGRYPSGGKPGTARPTGLNFRFKCTIGCAPLPPIQCHSVLRQAILDACKLALNAAGKLEAKPRDAATESHFKQVFGHEPSLPFPWACQGESGLIVACQFRMVADALEKAGTLYRCDSCKHEYDSLAVVDTAAIALVCRNEVLLCPPFWASPPFLRAGVIIHEMFHLRFPPFFQHCPKEKRGTSAYCYEALALLLAGFPSLLLLKILGECQTKPIA